jgi:hypothetical protein
VSATTANAPSGEILTPIGALNLALVPIPLVLPEIPDLPVRVVTEAVEMPIWRIKEFPESVTKA